MRHESSRDQGDCAEEAKAEPASPRDVFISLELGIQVHTITPRFLMWVRGMGFMFSATQNSWPTCVSCEPVKRKRGRCGKGTEGEGGKKKEGKRGGGGGEERKPKEMRFGQSLLGADDVSYGIIGSLRSRVFRRK